MIYNKSDYNKHWDTKALNELGIFSRGKSKHRPRNDTILFENGIYPFVQTGEIKEATLFIDNHIQSYSEFGLKQSKLWNSGTLCITIAANIAETAILAYPMCFPDSVVGFKAYDNISSEIFMYYVFDYIRTSIQKSASGSIQDNVNIKYLTNLKFKIPNKLTQDNLVKVLFVIDEKIRNNKKIISELESMAKTLYDYWFTQFDFPDENGKPYKSSGGKMVYNDELKREIPLGWEVKLINSLCNIYSGYPFKSFEYCKKGEYKLLTIKNVQDNGINENSNTYINKLPLNMPSYCKLKKGDILMSLTGNIGRVGLVFSDCCLLNQRVALINSKIISYRSYIYQLFKSQIMRTTLEVMATGTSQKNLSPIEIENTSIIYNEDIVDRFNKVIYDAHENIIKKYTENQQLTELRDWLLPMLMNGQAMVE